MTSGTQAKLRALFSTFAIPLLDQMINLLSDTGEDGLAQEVFEIKGRLRTICNEGE